MEMSGECTEKTLKTLKMVGTVANQNIEMKSNDMGNKTLTDLQGFDSILNNFNVNTALNDIDDLKVIENLVNDMKEMGTSDSVESGINHPFITEAEQKHDTKHVVSFKDNIENLVNISNNIKKENLEANYNNGLKAINGQNEANLNTYECVVNKDIDLHLNSNKNKSDERNRNLETNVEVDIAYFNRSRDDFNNLNYTQNSNHCVTPNLESWFKYYGIYKNSSSDKIRTDIKGRSDDLENIIPVNLISRSSDKNLALKLENAKIDDLFCGIDAKITSDVKMIDEIESKTVDILVNAKNIKLNITKENIDSDSDGYDSSDFEFIDEDEAKKVGFVIDKNLNDESNSLDMAIFQEVNEKLFLNDYFDTLKENNLEKHVIPYGDDYFELFLENANGIPSVGMENKSICRISTMHVEMQTFGNIKRELEVDPTLQEEVDDSVKAILVMYPDENRKRRYS